MKALTLMTLIALTVILTGCATLANTPAQDRVYARFEVCRQTYPQFHLVYVAPNGWFRAQPMDPASRDFIQCMTGSTNWYTY